MTEGVSADASPKGVDKHESDIDAANISRCMRVWEETENVHHPEFQIIDL